MSLRTFRKIGLTPGAGLACDYKGLGQRASLSGRIRARFDPLDTNCSAAAVERQKCADDSNYPFGR